MLCQKQVNAKKGLFFVQGIKVKELELELKVKNRGIKEYKCMSIDKLSSILDKLEQVK